MKNQEQETQDIMKMRGIRKMILPTKHTTLRNSIFNAGAISVLLFALSEKAE